MHPLYKKAITIACLIFFSMLIVNSFLRNESWTMFIPPHWGPLTRSAISLVVILINLLIIKYVMKIK